MKDYEGLLWDDLPILALDTETTGFSAEDRIVEIGLVILEGEKVVDEYSQLIDPGFSIPEEASRVNGITDEMLAGAPPWEAVADEVNDWFRMGLPIVVHNAVFDMRMLSYNIEPSSWPTGIPTLCTLNLSRQRGFKGAAKLMNMALRYNIPQYDAHRAADDARVCGLLARKLTAGKTISDCYTKSSEQWIH